MNILIKAVLKFCTTNQLVALICRICLWLVLMELMCFIMKVAFPAKLQIKLDSFQDDVKLQEAQEEYDA